MGKRILEYPITNAEIKIEIFGHNFVQVYNMLANSVVTGRLTSKKTKTWAENKIVKKTNGIMEYPSSERV